MLLLNRQEKQQIWSGFAMLLASSLNIWNNFLFWSTIVSMGVQVVSGITNIALAALPKKPDPAAQELIKQAQEDIIFKGPYAPSQHIYFLGR
ncbi:hypothetical protein [Ureaplasma zalophigenitalium]|uniref:Uncharacterized protein n=1 Tax=Ureaplasma zalophigenitalium TaxID=907723 RepID=A0ABT3BP82_9BACT|nr:hypothetical protein [Ureaplasma zalophigenitalium]MCV3754076.1 hypothetical protein [Ureaplasma zalophigenitalium]